MPAVNAGSASAGKAAAHQRPAGQGRTDAGVRSEKRTISRVARVEGDPCPEKDSVQQSALANLHTGMRT
eukprot:3168960-Pyramimonas_sp.AAC.1